MAAEKLAVEKKSGGGASGGLDTLGSLKDIDLGALMKELDPSMLQELLAEGMNDPALQEMVSVFLAAFGRAFHNLLCLYAQTCSLTTLMHSICHQ